MIDNDSLAEAFLEHCPALFWIAGPDGAFSQIHGDAAALFGASSSQLQGRTAEAVLGPGLGEQWQGRFSRAFDGETLMLRERRGDSTWNVSVFPIRRGAKITEVGGVAFDNGPWSSAEQELRNTVLSALKAQEFQRKMAARFLHDSVGQNLTALGLQLDLVRMDLATISPEIGARVMEVQQMLGIMMEEVREYSYELNPATVERAGLRPALDRLVSRMRHRFPGALRVNVDPSLKLDAKIASALFPIAQEAVENAIRHAACSAIEIAVKSTRKGAILEVKDNGRGFDPADVVAVRRGLGLLSMEHYAAQAGLRLTITSSGGNGTVVRAAGW
ncbi:MAG TPA: PAS domain-containing sensor histidine kinase [Bryobacteraceae bacterium]|jgi:signal transduction histidine kinase